MSTSFNKSFFHTTDVETSGISVGHKQTALLQLYSTNLSPYINARPFDPRTFVKPSSHYIDPITKQRVPFAFNFDKGQDVLSQAHRVGVLNEEQTVGRFFAAASEFKKHSPHRFVFAGWNAQYDTGVLEAITHRYSSLEHYRGFFKRQGVSVISLEKPFLEVAYSYGVANPDFAKKYFRMGPSAPIKGTRGPGLVAQSIEEMRYVPGWSVENITKAIGGREKLIGSIGQFHEAITDVKLEQELFEKFRLAKKNIRRGNSYEKSLSAVGVLPEGQTAETFFKQIFSSSWSGHLAKEAERGVVALPPRPSAFAGNATKILVGAAAITALYAIASSTRATRQTSITGLSDLGMAGQKRHETTDFGSGWVGGEDRSSLRTAEALLLGTSAYVGHKWALRNWAGYAEGLYQTFKKIEARSPSQIFNTFGLSQLQSSYLVNEVFLRPDQLIVGRELTATGKHVQRLIGINVLDEEFREGLKFVRMSSSSPYLELVGRPGTGIRFAERGRLTASSARLGADLSETLPTRITADGTVDELVKIFKRRQRNQFLRTPLSKSQAFKLEAGGEAKFFEPLFGRKEGLLGRVASTANTVERVAFQSAERPLKLLGDIGMGLDFGSYNKLAHIPFVGEGGLLNKLLLRRVLPIYGAVTAARYINYKLNNKPAEAITAVPLKAHVAWAEITDRVPGFRSVTDKYADIVPGPQYGPLALPIGAAAISVALGHYLPIARGAVEYGSRSIRKAASHAAFWKGAKWGALAMLPFLPGMLGSRQTADELRRVYSGEEEVPIKSGRWWDVGTTPFSGGRIKYFRKHWYPLMQAKSEMIATYGSEDAYWEHHPLLHPFKYIKDPYWLERANYYSRPYPITSPAFSNVPLVGSFLAGTIGRLIKPPARMHESDWDISNYTLYSPRLEPKGPIVESKLEAMVLKHLAAHGYQAETQVPVGKYRLDMVVTGENGERLAIEPEGYSYHHTKYQLRQDKERAGIIKAEKWRVANVPSREFFANPDVAMKSVYAQLDKLNIKPSDIGNRDINTGLYGLAPAIPREEFSLKDIAAREAISFAEFTGLPGFLATTIYGKYGPGGTPAGQVNAGSDVILQGSRQMTNLSRAYYQRELGAVSGFNPTDVAGMPFGYSEPLRRFIQPERLTAQANEIPNTMPHWLPGEDYMVNFRTGDPFTKVPEGGARLPGPGYAALHPELQGLRPEQYPDISRYKILADVAPYSKEYMIYKARIRNQALTDTSTAIEFARTEDQVRQMRESTVQFEQRRFTAPVEKLTGKIKKATPQGLELEEYPGRTFTFSSIGMSAADLSAIALGEQNDITRAQTIQEVDRRQLALHEYLAGKIGTEATLVVPVGTKEHAQEARAVVFIDNVNLNNDIMDRGLAIRRKDMSGAEAQAMYGSVSNALGKYAETLSFAGEGGPLRFVPTPFHTKYWNERTALSLYQEQEVYGSRMRRWQRPIHDMIAPWARGLYHRATGQVLMPEEVERKRQLDSAVDELDYLRGQIQASFHPGAKGRYTSQSKRTNIGGDLFGSSSFVATTLPRREKIYFQAFLQETNPEKRQQILESVSPELAKALTAQWIKADAAIARAEGREVPQIEQGGMLYTERGLKDYEQAKTNLSYSDYIRSKEISETFSKLGFDIPGASSPLWTEGLDYEDVKLKIVQNEGYDYHDFNIYDDRAAMLWRKPYVDGAVRELTSGGGQSAERIRQTVERIIIEGQDKNPTVSASTMPNRTAGSSVTINIDEQGDKDVMRDIRRNPDQYRSDTTN